MPNTGRFYAPPPAAAAYRERFMRPYSTVSPPMGSSHHHTSVGALPSTKTATPPTASYSRASMSMRRPAPSNDESYSPYGNSYESRLRSRPSPSYDEERRWSDAYADKQFPRTRSWSEEDEEEEVSVRRGAPLASVGQTRFMEMSRQQHIAPAVTYDSRDAKTTHSRTPFEEAPLPSTLPRLSSLLKRTSAEVENYESEDRFLTRKRARELSPKKSQIEHGQAKSSRHFYEDDVYADRHMMPQYNEPVWTKDGRAQDVRGTRREMPMAVKNTGTYANESQQLSARSMRHSPVAPTQPFSEQVRYPYTSDDRSEQFRRPRAMHHEESVVRPEYEESERAYDQQRRNYYSADNQRNQPTPTTLSSPPPTAVARDRFSPVGRYSASKEGDCVIEAAADLVEERSPSKRESITKLLLKSKEFLKAKSLVRNRNNEIDWVATFLNVGFESNSIYSLMCPLRKGRWKVEEEKYTMELLRLIEAGAIRLRHGQSIRGFIAKKLHSDDMRVLKKLSNCKMFHFARLINPRMAEEEEIDHSIPNVRASLDRLEKLKAEFLRSVQLEALVAVRKYLSDTSIRDLLNARD